MITYAVSWISFYDNELHTEIVEAKSWKEALVSVSFVDNTSSLPDSIEEAKEEAFNSDCMFEVVPIKIKGAK